MKYLERIYRLTDFNWFQLFALHLIVWQIVNGLAYSYEKIMGLPIVMMWYDIVIYTIMLLHFAYASYHLSDIRNRVYSNKK